MGTPGSRSNYLAAFNRANAELDDLFHEYKQLQERKEKIEDLLMALEPFTSSAGAPSRETHHPEPVITLPVSFEVSQKNFESDSAAQPEPPLSAQPLSVPPQVELDPIQRRINSALGLAVA